VLDSFVFLCVEEKGLGSRNLGQLRTARKPRVSRLGGLAVLLAPCGRCGAYFARLRRETRPFQSLARRFHRRLIPWRRSRQAPGL